MALPGLLSPVSCLLPPASCLLPPASCLLPPTSYLLPPASCLLSPVSCLLPPTSCLQPSYNPCLAMAPQVHVLRGDGLAERRLRAEHVVARALVEASTFAEAVPRILEAICSALDWEHGALWDIDRQTDVLRCAEIWTARVRRVPRVRRRQPLVDLPAGHGAAWPGLGERRAGVDSRRDAGRQTSRARRSRPAKDSTRRSASRSCCAAKCSA